MYAKPNQLGSVESLTVETNNVAGSLRLIIELPFEARRFEFSLPAGEESLDASNEEEVPVLRRVIDTHASEEVRTTSLPTVIKEVCIARFGGVRNRAEWFSARGVIEPVSTAIVPADAFPDVPPASEPAAGNAAPVMADGGEALDFDPNRSPDEDSDELVIEAAREAIDEAHVEDVLAMYDDRSLAADDLRGFLNDGPHEVYKYHRNQILLSDDEPTVMTDGGIEIEGREFGYSIASCPRCGEQFRARSDERVRSFISDEHLPVCGEFEPIKVRWEGYARSRISEYNSEFENEDSDRFLCSVNRQKTNIVLLSPEEANSFVNELSCYDSGQRTWMNAMQDKALDRVAGGVIEAMRERGFEVGNRDCFGHVTEFERASESGSSSGSDDTEGESSSSNNESEETASGSENKPVTDGGNSVTGPFESASAAEFKIAELLREHSEVVVDAGFGEYVVSDAVDVWPGRENYTLNIEAEAGTAGIAAVDIVEVRPASEPELVTDGGSERLPRFCPNDDEPLEPRPDEPLEVECPKCGYAGVRNLRGERVKVCHKRVKITENSRGDGEAYMAEAELGGIVQRIALSRSFVRDAVAPEDDEPEVMTDGGSEEEPHPGAPTENEFSGDAGVVGIHADTIQVRAYVNTESGHSFRSYAESDPGERTSVKIEAGKTHFEHRRTRYSFEGFHYFPGINGPSFLDGEVRLSEVNGDGPEYPHVLDDLSLRHFLSMLDNADIEPAPEPEVVTDGGEDIDEEPHRWRDWSNVKEEKESRLVPDGGYTFGGPRESVIEPCPECGSLVNRYVNGNRCPYCHAETFEDDGILLGDGGSASVEEPHPDDEGVEILTDGGRPVREHEEHRTLMGEYNPEEWNPEPDPDYYRSGSVSIHDPIEGEAFSEPGHWADRPADMDAEHARRLALRGEFDDLDEHQPLPLISSDMRGVPTEGVQGSYSEVTELDEPCEECEQEFGILSVVTMAGVHQVKCLVCNHVIEQG